MDSFESNPQVSGTPPQFGPMDVQMLSTEHWSLLSTRSLIWNEMFTRASMFLTLVSAAVVALALVAQATDFGENFRLVAYVLLPIVLFVGFATFARLVEANMFNLVLEMSMNRLRHAYFTVSPQIESYFTTSGNDDEAGIMQSIGLANESAFGFLWSTPFVISVVNATIAGMLAGVVVESLGAARSICLLGGVIVGIAIVLLSTVYAARKFVGLRSMHTPRFPSLSGSDTDTQA